MMIKDPDPKNHVQYCFCFLLRVPTGYGKIIARAIWDMQYAVNRWQEDKSDKKDVLFQHSEHFTDLTIEMIEDGVPAYGVTVLLGSGTYEDPDYDYLKFTSSDDQEGTHPVNSAVYILQAVMRQYAEQVGEAVKFEYAIVPSNGFPFPGCYAGGTIEVYPDDVFFHTVIDLDNNQLVVEDTDS